ncbi:hypothetical protein EVAR_84999_1 [Eumeta japonica]|uniref:Uncharacterized protein n=1 Tax=Eumeta variegata TaxID=151549 RepID=A0A4C1WB83_EUMVA|nr:hypothetical protein EVAR_84999_1 [Eumeta japonica]
MARQAHRRLISILRPSRRVVIAKPRRKRDDPSYGAQIESIAARPEHVGRPLSETALSRRPRLRNPLRRAGGLADASRSVLRATVLTILQRPTVENGLRPERDSK